MSILRSISETLNTSQRAGLLAAVMVLFSGVIISAVTYNHLYTQLVSEQNDNDRRQLQHLGALLTPGLVRDDRITLNLTLDEWQSGASIPALRLLDREGKPLATKGRNQEGLVPLTVEIRQDGVLYGQIEGYTSTAPATASAGRFAALALLVTAMMTLICGVAGWLLSERYIRYLRQLQLRLNQWRDGDSLRLPMGPDNPELSSLHDTLKEIARREEQKKAVDEALGQFIGNSESPFPEPMKYYDCAMLFIEIQDLELLQQRLSAEELTRTLNQYHRLLTQAAKLYNGKVDRFLGDGVVMLFGIPNKDRNAAMHCLYAARLFTGLVDYLRENNAGILPLEFNIAAHWGPVLMAPLQDDVSTQYSLIGDTVHWAAHLATQSEERRILVSQTMIEMMEHGHDVIWTEGPAIRDFHGSSQTAYWLDSLPEKTESLIARQIKHITSMTEKA